MGVIEDRLTTLGLTLPPPFRFPSPNRTGCVQVGNLLFVSGHGILPELPPIKTRGKVDSEVSVEEAYQTARAVALSMLSSIKQQIGELDRVKRVVRLFGMVNSAPNFDRQPAVIDGASDLFLELWGPVYGQHARSAVGMAELPRRIPVEINGEFELNA